MRLALNVVRLLGETARFALATRRASLVVAVALGFVLVVITVATALLAPFAVYPFL